MARRGREKGKGRARKEAAGGLQQLPYQNLKIPYQPYDIVSEDELQAIHSASMDVLEQVGINFLLPEARDILKAAGADVTQGDARVRFDRVMVEELVSRAPAEFSMYARNPAHNVHYGGNNINFALVASPPNVSDTEGGRRQGNMKDYCDLIRLGQSLNIVHMIGGYPCEPADVPANIRHLKAESETIKLSDKGAFGYSLGYHRIHDSMEMARISRGITYEQMRAEPSIMTTVNANSPLQYDIPMLIGMIEMAKMGQPVNVTPFTLAGAMAPVTLAGALAQQNAEALAGIAFMQAVNPGTPAWYGGFTSNVDMKSGAPAFGTPEYSKAVLIGGQLTRKYGIPYRSSNVNASNAPDAQAAYESQMSIWPCMLAHCNLVKHAVGWQEGGLCASFEKTILDAEMLQMISEVMRPVDFSPDEFGLDAIKEVGPGGHYFGAAHTMERYETAFYAPMLSDWRNFESWEEDGSPDSTVRAHKIYKQLLADYVPPPADPAMIEELDAFVDRRIAEGGQDPYSYEEKK